jgi:single-strand DNA-binding protein
MSIPTIQGLAGITADPDMKYTPQGRAVLSVRLAFSDRRFNEQTREWDTTKSFYVDGTAWEETAERLSQQLAKGDQVYVEGRLETQSWEKDGDKRSKPVLQLRAVRKLEKGNGGQQQPQQQAPARQQGGWGNAPAQADPWGQPQTTEPAF